MNYVLAGSGSVDLDQKFDFLVRPKRVMPHDPQIMPPFRFSGKKPTRSFIISGRINFQIPIPVSDIPDRRLAGLPKTGAYSAGTAAVCARKHVEK